jgi:hypothetical protein
MITGYFLQQVSTVVPLVMALVVTALFPDHPTMRGSGYHDRGIRGVDHHWCGTVIYDTAPCMGELDSAHDQNRSDHRGDQELFHVFSLLS